VACQAARWSPPRVARRRSTTAKAAIKLAEVVRLLQIAQIVTVLRIGRSTLVSELRRLDRDHDYLELDIPDSSWPKPKVFETLRARAPQGFEFGIRLPRELTALPAGNAAEVIESARSAASRLGASWLVLSDAASSRPTLKVRETLSHLFERLKSADWRVAWQAHGLWEAGEARIFAEANAVELVVDPAEPKAVVSSRCYCRVSRLSLRSSLKPAQAERIAEKLAPTEKAYLVLPRKGSEPDTSARLLRSMLAPFQAGEDDAEFAVAADQVELADAELGVELNGVGARRVRDEEAP
jgi:hypothetical protein